jgi:Cu(I)/Ag(I) efflux system membrane fusion protein/cobalt-zinc-cadmium efflux system membrane fusion protein
VAGSPRRPRHLRSGAAWLWVVLVFAALIAGVGGGLWTARHFGLAATAQEAPLADQDTSEQLYTCGMHPDVIQKGPGDCPICHMKLTPMKQDGDADEAKSGPRERRILYWRAPMDPSYVSDRPGQSPMEMDLVPVYADEAESSSGHTIRIDPITVQNMGVRTTTVTRRPLVKTIRTVGRVDYNEQTVTFLDTKFEGWIEKLHVDETGVLIEKGQPLFEVYSPKLYSAQEEFLAALRGAERLAGSTVAEAREQAKRLAEAARIQLKYFDVSEEQIDALERTKEIQKTLTIHSPARGIVTEKMALEGMYVRPGMRLYTIADLSHVWVYVDVYEYQLPWVKIGQEAKMTLAYLPGAEFSGRVVYIYPYLEKQTRVVRVRLEFENPTLELKPDMYANILLQADLERDALVVPREAYIDSGTRKVAFVDLGGGRFQPREIQTGVEAEDGMVEVLYGLDEHESIVTSGQFLLDGESKLKEAVAKMRAVQRGVGTAAPKIAHDHQMPEHDHATSTGIPSDAKYACPMDTHPSETDPARQGAFFSTEAGRCDWCGMTLKPIEELAWVQARLAAGGGDVAYTCPDHPHVFSGTGDQCPRCGKTLEPFKAVYTCPDSAHADVISLRAGTCSRDGLPLAPFRGVWLSPEMAERNSPADSRQAEAAAYRCAVHPLIHSDHPGNCLVCGQDLHSAEELVETGPDELKPEAPRGIPHDAKYVCPMDICWHWSPEPGECPECGMEIMPIAEVDWAQRAFAEAMSSAPAPAFVCPMHAEVRSDQRGTCSICGMQLVSADAVPHPTSAPAAIAVQMDFLMEHYLALQQRFAADQTSEAALHALGLAAAADDLAEQLDDPGVSLPPAFAQAVRKLRSAALKINGKNLETDRVTFHDLSAAMATLVEHVRPDTRRYPKIYIFHCPMTKGDWLQTSDQKANPYYGFKMLDCGELKATR